MAAQAGRLSRAADSEGVTSLQTLLTEGQLRQRVAELGREIGKDYRDRPLTVVGVLTGSLVFLADLTRQLPIAHRIAVLQASSYRGPTTTPGKLDVNVDLVPNLAGRDVLLLDDILDTGHTLSAVVKEVERQGPLSVRTVVLVRKRGRQEVPIEPDYYGFDIPDVYVVGYGMDYDDDLRHLPYLAGLGPDELEGSEHPNNLG